jgi:hypothetical protein
MVSSRKPVLLPWVLIIAAVSLRPVLGQPNLCDPGLKPARDHPNAYRLRHDRCEGVYFEDVAGSGAFRIVSFTESMEGFEPGYGVNLLVSWTSPVREPVRLRAYGLTRRLYYRMDTVRPAGSNAYLWPSDIAKSLGLSRADVGLVARTWHYLGNTKRELYLPIRVEKTGRPLVSGTYQFVILPIVDLSRLSLSLAPVRSDGMPGSFIKKAETLHGSPYPAERRIVISLPLLKGAGVYLAEITASLSAGGISTVAFFFYHPGP